MPLSELARRLALAVEEPMHINPAPEPDSDMLLEVRMAEMDRNALQDDERPGHPSPFSCPDCGGVLWEIGDESLVHFRCRVGHAYSAESMLGAQADVLEEEALWSAVKTLEESARLSKRLARTERQRGHDWLAERFEQKEREARQHVDVIRKFLVRDSAEVPA